LPQPGAPTAILSRDTTITCALAVLTAPTQKATNLMTTEETQPMPADPTVQQIPAVIKVREIPAAAVAREKLLQAIAAEAEVLTNTFQGQASTALEKLAQAYALVTSGATAVAPAGETTTVPLQSRAGGHQVGLCLELEP
jgi:hypothetical protein